MRARRAVFAPEVNRPETTMEPNIIDVALTYSAFASGGLALFLVVLNAAAYGLTEGKGGPYVKQMVACLAAIVVFVLSGLAKIVRCVA